MASISSIVSLGADATPGPESTAYTRASSMASFPGSDDSRALSPATTFAATPSRGSTPSAALSAVLPTAADAAASAAAASADASRRRKVLTSRPPNSFILYRSDKLRELVARHPELKQTQISKMCADNWRQESAAVKEHYRRKQQEAKAQFLSEQAQEVERISGGAPDKMVIKRIQPTNTFIRYRTEMKKKLASQFAAMNQKDVSRACGLMWRSEPESVKMRYRQSYTKEKRDFERLCASSALDEQPSEQALSALASVIADASRVPTPAKKRRLSDGCRSAPVSPPQPEPAEHVRSKRLRSFHAPSPVRDESPAEPARAISLPSCASLLSMAGGAARGLSGLPQPLPFRKQPELLRHAFPAPHYAHAHYLPPPQQHMPYPPYHVHN